MRFVETDYSNKKEMLKFADHFVAIGVMVDDTDITADEDGKKIVAAGTIVGGASQSALVNSTEPVAKKNTQDTDATEAEGILLEDVDVTYGNASGAMIIHGFIDVNKLPEAPTANAITALKQITFIG